MPSPKVDLILEGRILGLIDLGRSYRQISREIEETTGQKVSKSKVGKVCKRKLSSPEGPTRKWRKMTQEKLEKLKSMVSNDNPLPQRSIAAKLGLHLKTVQHHINKTLNMEKRKKKKVHRLNEEQKKKRRERTPELLRIIENNLQRIITSDESLFYLQGTGGHRDIYYARRGEEREKKFFERVERFSKKVMVWGGISFHSRTNLYFVEPGIKINGISSSSLFNLIMNSLLYFRWVL